MTNLGYPRPGHRRTTDQPGRRPADPRFGQALGIRHVVDNRFEWSDGDFVAESPAPRSSTSTTVWTTTASRCRTSGSTSAFRVRPAVPSGSRAGQQGSRSLPHGHQPGPLAHLRSAARPRLGPHRGDDGDPHVPSHRRHRLRRRRPRLAPPSASGGPNSSGGELASHGRVVRRQPHRRRADHQGDPPRRSDNHR